MHITLYHDALIPPVNYGGTERVIRWLAKGLVELGHQVSLIARTNSALPHVTTYWIRPSQPWTELIPPSTDILHLWTTPPLFPKKPFLITIEGNGKPNEIFHQNTVFVSRCHAHQHGSHSFVHNGIDPQEFECSEQRDHYFVFLAKASWKVKNLKGAIHIAHRLNTPLHVMGNRYQWPFPWKGIHYCGMLGDTQKNKILSRAKALLFPVRWHEPFGVALLEALASGCAVYGTPYGSLPEIITPAVGALSHQSETLIHAIQTQSITPQQCREHVMNFFTHQHMAQNYLSRYQEILTQGALMNNPQWIQTHSDFSPNTLLPWH